MFAQQFTINALVGDRLVPLMFVLISAKTADLYNGIFTALKTEIAARGLAMALHTIMSDSESSLILAVAKQFPGAHHKACYFNFCQAI